MTINLENKWQRRKRRDRGSWEVRGQREGKRKDVIIPLAQVPASVHAPALMLYLHTCQYNIPQWDFLPPAMHLMNQGWEKLRSPGHLPLRLKVLGSLIAVQFNS